MTTWTQSIFPDCIDDRTPVRLDHLSRRPIGTGAGYPGLDRHETVGADFPWPAVVRPQPIKPEPRPGGGAALHPSVSVGPDHRHHPAVLGVCRPDGARPLDPRAFRQARK